MDLLQRLFICGGNGDKMKIGKGERGFIECGGNGDKMKIGKGERGIAKFIGATFFITAVLSIVIALWSHDGRVAWMMLMLAVTSGWLYRFGVSTDGQ